MRLKFWKMSGAGNDFVAMNNMEGWLEADPDFRRAFIAELCARRTGIGADGFLLVEPSEAADFRMRYYNSDGGEAETCGNGARCISRFANLQGIVGNETRFETQAGLYAAQIYPDSVRVSMSDALGLEMNIALELDDVDPGFLEGCPQLRDDGTVDFINSGVPHILVPVEHIESAPVCALGRVLRFHPRFEPPGTNVNFIAVTGPNNLAIRTYERGVEDETLACGTGSIAAAIISQRRGLVSAPVDVLTQSGKVLTIGFEPCEAGGRKVTLQGEARVVYTGEFEMPG
ncbi:MAG: diaminopimelate epimerase [Candidatus Sumerlaeia bacterium]